MNNEWEFEGTNDFLTLGSKSFVKGVARGESPLESGHDDGQTETDDWKEAATHTLLT